MLELDKVLIHATRTARYFAKQRHRLQDKFFLDEMATEAIFIVTELIYAGPSEDDQRTSLQRIKEKFPDDDERYKFYRMTVGYGLKAYCAYRPMRTISYLRAKGIVIQHEKLEDEYVPRNDHSALMQLYMDEAAKTPMEKEVLKFYLLANEWEVIGEKVGLNPKRVRKVMKRIKRRLRETETNPAGN